MPVEYTIEHKDSIVEVQVSGAPDRHSAARLWQDIAATCRDRQCYSVLGISNISAPLKIADAIDHQAIFLEAGITPDHRVAWVQLNPDAYAMAQLVETLLLNRGLVDCRLFDDALEARRWLTDI